MYNQKGLENTRSDTPKKRLRLIIPDYTEKKKVLLQSTFSGSLSRLYIMEFSFIQVSLYIFIIGSAA